MRLNDIAQQYIYAIKSIAMVFVILLTTSICATHSMALPTEHYAQHSVLSSGKWYKIAVTNSGIHQISYSQLKSWGFNNPTEVRIYGYGGKVLPEVYSDSDIDDLPQIPVVHCNDRILFYAQGTIKWMYDEKQERILHKQNTYSTAGYYFITENSTEACTTDEAPLDPNPVGELVDMYDGYSLHEEELVSVSKTGQVFLGEDFRFTQTRTFSFDIPGIDPQTPMKVDVAFGAKIIASTGSLRLYHNGTLLS
ncbi:MAG: hypothetical protein IIV86_01915, partial [Bacteroidaceae bacterium]|nr:hypothetical protein [Bacteroidaceae bacterium]